MDRNGDLVVIGAGAAGLMAVIQAARAAPGRRVTALDGAARLGAKILIAGGGRCNVTHDRVEADAFAGSSRAAIRKVLGRFGVPETVAFFREIGVELKREPDGKLFPVTDRARTVLDALIGAAERAGVELLHPRRVERVVPADGGFDVMGAWGTVRAVRLILATGGKSVPKTGSDGAGYEIARSLGHSVTPRILPALVPLGLADRCFLRALRGVASEAAVEVRGARGKALARFTGSVLCTHFGISGPAVLDASRYYLAAAAVDPSVRLVIRWLPEATPASLDAALLTLGGSSPGRWLARSMPLRLARALCAEAGVDPSAPAHAMTRGARRALVAAVLEAPLPVTGSRGFAYAEVTAGGVPLTELRLETLESRVRPGLHVCGEICDVDGRIGGYNFQWAWASGFVAGTAAARALSG
jgi:predicted Rossmann fold flavoprotein